MCVVMNDKKRKQKQYYVNQAKRAKYEKKKLHPGLKGFLCTTNHNERECVREAYNILNEFANEMHGPETRNVQSQPETSGQEVEDSLEAELAELQKQKSSPERRRFQQVESGAKNCIFISTQLEKTVPLVEKIVQTIEETGKQRTRYLLRLLPVEVVCKATVEDIRKSAENMIKEAFSEVGVTYTTVFKSRNQSQLTQTEAQTVINELIDAVCPTAELNHKTPQLTVLMEVLRNVICLSVVHHFFRYKKYNLIELAKSKSESATSKETFGGGTTSTDAAMQGATSVGDTCGSSSGVVAGEAPGESGDAVTSSAEGNVQLTPVTEQGDSTVQSTVSNAFDKSKNTDTTNVEGAEESRTAEDSVVREADSSGDKGASSVLEPSASKCEESVKEFVPEDTGVDSLTKDGQK